MHIVLCGRRMARLLRLGFIPVVGAANPHIMGGGVSRSVCMAVARAIAPDFPWGKFWPAGVRNHHMFAVLLWALSVDVLSRGG